MFDQNSVSFLAERSVRKWQWTYFWWHPMQIELFPPNSRRKLSRRNLLSFGGTCWNDRFYSRAFVDHRECDRRRRRWRICDPVLACKIGSRHDHSQSEGCSSSRRRRRSRQDHAREQATLRHVTAISVNQKGASAGGDNVGGDKVTVTNIYSGAAPILQQL